MISGFAGGKEKDPLYIEVVSGNTGHREAVQVTYDPDIISYEQLLAIFWRQIDPTDAGGQFADRGFQYSTAIFYHTQDQRQLARESHKKLDASDKFEDPIVTEIEAYTTFYPADQYHQDYYLKNPLRYKFYKAGSGRTGYIERTWKD